ncbi:hypothetical protein SAMN04487913_102282 [Arthrobacter sp. ok362]|jgi:hypothetical protein|nr:hypothetical protein SAMN04487913_102282 [Arthrobacter sp. ok362]
MSLRCYFCLTAIEVEPDKNPEFVVQTIPLFVLLPLGRDAATALAATLRPQPSLGRECDAGNSALHIGETSRYVPVVGEKVLIGGPGVL